MRVIEREAIRAALDFPSLVDAIEAAHRRPKIEIAERMMDAGGGAQYFVRHAVDAGRYLCSKLITIFPDNPGRGPLPAVQASCVLFDGTDGRPLALIDGTEVTYWRTAADS
ncbi:MAG: dehydrogenase, partial [Hyphomicrobiales bacterium]|nr:dehydrogenase [Hyphomicrobiales bacterium]